MDVKEQARVEIEESFYLSTLAMKGLGLTYEPPASRAARLAQKLLTTVSFFSLFYHIFSDFVNISLTMSRSPRVEDVVPLLHTCGYGTLSSAKLFPLWYHRDVFGQLLKELTQVSQFLCRGSAKLFAVWYHRDVFGQLLKELADIWPVPPLDAPAQTVKDKSLAALKITQRGLFVFNVSGLVFYATTPLLVYGYEKWQWSRASEAVGAAGAAGVEEPRFGFVWVCWYPFDKHQPVTHFFVYLFEITSGLSCVWAMIASDLMFSGMASHICMLLRLLNRRVAAVGQDARADHYRDLVDCVRLHQRLITYSNELEKTFSIGNLVNIVLSSINICCVVFVIVLLEPLVAVSNKLFLMSVLIQIAVICWYSDDIFQASTDTAMAAYNSGWYHTDPRCRRVLLFLIKRSQKSIAFTAMNFTNINLTTYSSILTRSYSYFALLYTMYNEK